MIEKFEDIKAWQKARKLRKKISNISKNNKFSRDYVMRDQIRRASLSVMNNIAEGFGKQSKQEFIHYLFISHGSAAEVQSTLYAALDDEYITKKEFNDLYERTEEISKMVSGLINYLSNRKPKGINDELETDNHPNDPAKKNENNEINKD